MTARAIIRFFMVCASCSQAFAGLVEEEIDWPELLGQHDLVWEQLPRQWNEGAFAGNGNMGFVAFATLRDNRIDFHLGRMDVTDHRKAPGDKTSMGVPGTSVMYDFPRLDVGRLVLRPAGKILDGTMRQHLWNAEITGEVQTDLGLLRFRALTLRNRMLTLVEVSYISNPAPWREEIDGVPVAVTSLLAGGDFATAWLEKPTGNGTGGVVYISTANEIPKSEVSARVAVDEVRKAAEIPLETLIGEHRAAWQEESRRSFVSLPGDPRLESFYWIQMHKLAARLRPDGPALDVLGPFYRTTQWPGLWWNLNVQLSYWPVYAGNRLDFGQTLADLLETRFTGLFETFRNRKTLGDFAWVLHNHWWQHRFAGDWQALRERWLPKANRVLAAYQTRLETTPDGRLRLQPMGSPEYHGFETFPNTTYNLALLHWLLNAMIECDSRTSPTPDPAAAEWKKTLASILRIPVYMHNLEASQLFCPAAWTAFGTADAERADFRACASFDPLYRRLP